MRAVVQRASRAHVRVGDDVIASIGAGLLVLVGVAEGDDPADASYLAAKIARLRIMQDADGRMNHSVLDAGGGVLLVSQFTLIADTRKGRRPSFTRAAQPEAAQLLLQQLATELEELGVQVRSGRFGASMDVELVNTGPVTIVLDSADRHTPRRQA